MRSAVVALTATVVFFATTGCALRGELELHQANERIAELEKHLAGKDEDNAMLQLYAIQLQDEILAWQRGAAMQAQAMARLRSNCDL